MGKLGTLGSTSPASPARPALAVFPDSILKSNLFFPVVDFFSILLIPVIACFFTAGRQNAWKNIDFWVLLAATTVSLIGSYGKYGSGLSPKSFKSTETAICCYIATSITMMTVALIMGHEHAVSRHWSTAELCLTPMLMALTRAGSAQRVMHLNHYTEKTGPVVICHDHFPSDMGRALREQNIINPVSGVLYLSDHPRDEQNARQPLIPNVKTLLETVQAGNTRDVIFLYHGDLESISGAGRRELLGELLSYPARIWLAINLEPQLPNMMMSKYGRYKIVPISTDRLVNSYNLAKRLLDLTLGLASFLAVLPCIAVIAVLVRAGGPGPVIFRQTRIGAHGKKITVLKFRTMDHAEGAYFAQATRNDARVTSVGRFLRRSSLDEILQLINVIRGDMSLVGPRPHAPETQVEGVDFENAVNLYRLRHRVKPGMTGLAQIRGQRGETSQLDNLRQRLASDLEYIERWSIWLDLSILLRTIPAVISQKNAL